MSALRVVVIDDEPLAREGLAELLEMIPEVTVVGAYADGQSAIQGLEGRQVDVLFVDVQMPGMSGFELVELLDLDPFPQVVFVTAHDAYAIKAFEINATDYLLKPATLERLQQTIARLRAEGSPRDLSGVRQKLLAVMEAMPAGRSSGVGRLIVREVGQVIVVATRDVDWIEGADYYAKLHVGPKVHLLRETLASLEERLDPSRFLRVHRSALVNLSRVKAVEAGERGDGVVVLTGGTRVKVMRARREELERRLEALHDAG
ncbi:MAG: LytTR family DNA-binding domain-containing protein [Gemmatimonadota bacterium]